MRRRRSSRLAISFALILTVGTMIVLSYIADNVATLMFGGAPFVLFVFTEPIRKRRPVLGGQPLLLDGGTAQNDI
jgi:4-hydroxybenzoate polyprenyltransferase